MKQEYKDYLITKKQKVLMTLAPYLELFGIEGDYIITETGGELLEYLVLNGQKIGCTCNSVEAIFDEFIAYLFVKIYCRNRSLGAFEKQTLNRIKQYWRN